MLKEAYPVLHERRSLKHSDTQAALAALIDVLKRQGKQEEANALAQTSQAIISEPTNSTAGSQPEVPP